MSDLMKRFWTDESGATAIEYGLLVALIGMGIVFSLTNLQGALTGLFTSIQNKVPN